MSIGFYIHELAPRQAVAELVHQAGIAEESGFDGMTLSEHHAGRPGYLPSPLQAIGWLLGSTRQMWGAACPILLSLRIPELVAEEIAWLAARFPGRVGAGFAPGATAIDFDVARARVEDRSRVFGKHLAVVAAALRGQAGPPLSNDAAIAECRTQQITCLSAIGGPLSAKRAADAKIGAMSQSSGTLEEARHLFGLYTEGGGNGPRLLSRRVWFGKPDPRRREALNKSVEPYRSSTSVSGPHFRAEFIASDDPDALASALTHAVGITGATALNVKFAYPGVTPEEMREQIMLFGRNVLPLVHREWPKVRQNDSTA